MNVERFWDFLVQGRSAVSDIPSDRFNIEAFYHPSAGRQSSMNVRRGHFLKEDVSKFDAPFFTMPKSEADATDPLQRLLLEVSYEAFENAGIPISKLAGSNTSAYASSFMNDYKTISAFDVDHQPLHASTGNSIAMISNRLSWFYDLRGPSLTLDTACSGSMTAFHLACESIRSGESEIALARGVNLLLSPEPYISMTDFHFLSPDGISYSFDERANGYSRGEGFAAIVLKPLSAAIRDNDTVRAIIRGTAIAQDGKTPGITLPSREAQCALIQTAYKNAGLGYNDTGYFEAHGTGTVAGDKAELGAVADTFSASRDANQKLIVGSVKTNIGHLEGAAGLAGIVKAILVAERGVIPANLRFVRPHVDNDLEKYCIAIPTEAAIWPTCGVRRVSVNCFGFGGTIGHVILDDVRSFAKAHGLEINHNTAPLASAPAVATRALSGFGQTLKTVQTTLQSGRSSRVRDELPQLLTWSAPEQDAVNRNVLALRDALLGSIDLREQHQLLRHLAYTLNQRRTSYPWRTALLIDHADHLTGLLDEAVPRVQRIPEESRVCFVFTGQGAQWPAMGLTLRSYLVFNESLVRADAYLTSLGSSWSAIAELERPADVSNINKPAISQTLCTVVQTALVNLLHDWSVHPVGVVGHSSGEVAAAYCAGAITERDAWRIAFQRGVASSQAPKGAMMAVGLSAKDVQKHIVDLELDEHVQVACINSPINTTISGNEVAIDMLYQTLDALKIFARKLKVEVAYHSRAMQVGASQYASAMGRLSPLAPDQPRCRMFSSVIGREVTFDEITTDYFVNNLVSPVRFTDAITACNQAISFTMAVEVGPHAALKSAVRQTLAKTTLPYTSLLSRGQNSLESAMKAAGDLWINGCAVSLSHVNAIEQHGNPRCLTTLTPYQWNHANTYWFENQQSKAQRFRKYPRLDLLGAPHPASTNLQQIWRNHLRRRELAWITEHQVQDSILYPAAGMLVMVLEAAQQITSDREDVQGFELYDVRIMKAMVVPDTPQGLETKLNLVARKGEGRTSFDFAVMSRSSDDTWLENCTGILSLHLISELGSDALDAQHSTKYQAADSVCADKLGSRSLYEKSNEIGMHWGPMFQCIRRLRANSLRDTSCFEISIPNVGAVMPENFVQPHIIHPTTFDAAFQALILALETGKDPCVPTSIDYVYVSRLIPNKPDTKLAGYAKMITRAKRSLSGDVVLHSKDPARPDVIVRGLTCSGVEGTPVDDGSEQLRCATTVWMPDYELMTSSQMDSHINNKSLMSTNGLARAVASCVELIFHKKTELSILETGSGSLQLALAVLKILSVDSSAAIPAMRYTIAGGLEGPQAPRLAELESYGANITRCGLEVADGVSGGHDIVIIHGERCSNSTAVEDALRDADKLLSFSGMLIIQAHREMLNDTTTMTAIANSGFKLQAHFDVTELQQHAVAVCARAGVATKPLPPVVLLVSSAQSEFSSLAVQLRDCLQVYCAVETLTTQQAMSRDLSGSCVVSLIDLDSMGVAGWSEAEFTTIRHILLSVDQLIWIMQGATIVSTNPGAASLLGLLRAVRCEDANLKLHVLDLEGVNGTTTVNCADSIVRLLRMLTQNTGGYAQEWEFAERDGMIFVPRVVPDATMSEAAAPIQEVKLSKQAIGTESLELDLYSPDAADKQRFKICALEDALADGDVEVTSLATVMHPVDARTIRGETTSNTLRLTVIGLVSKVGALVTGIIKGDRVAIFRSCTLATTSRLPAREVQKLHIALDNACAAAIASEYTAAYHILANVARLEAGERCMIAEPTLPLGQAAIQLARHLDGEVFVTVTSIEEQTYAIEELNVPADHVLSKALTTSVSHGRDKMWDVVVCDEQTIDLQGYWQRMADFGRLVQTVAMTSTQRPLARGMLHANTASYQAVDLRVLAEQKPKVCAKALQSLFALVESGHLKPKVSTLTYSYAEVDDAVEQAIGPVGTQTIVLEPQPDNVVSIVAPELHPLGAHLHSDGTYVLVGGLGGVGRSVAKYLVKNGAQHLAFFSRSGGASSDVQQFLHWLESHGAVSARAFACDIVDRDRLQHTLTHDMQDMPPIRGLINAAMVLRDALSNNMSYSDFQVAVRPKIIGSWNLHQLLPLELDFFVMLSSITGIGGMNGQCNYAAGNTYQDGLAQYRRKLGLSAVSIDLAVVLGVGVVAENMDIIDSLRNHGVTTMAEEEVLSLLKPALTGFSVGTKRTPAQVVTGIGSGGYLARKGVTEAIWLRDNRFIHTMHVGISGTSDPASSDPRDLSALLPNASTLADATVLVLRALVARLAKALGVSAEDIVTSKCVSDYGVDSLAAVGIRNWIQRSARSTVSIFDLMGTMRIKDLAEKIANGSSWVREELKGE